jgi:hypothetical protein
MQNSDGIQYAKLLGFAAVRDQPSGKIDFRDEHFGARLGAKVGDKVWVACDLAYSSCDGVKSGEAPDETAA